MDGDWIVEDEDWIVEDGDDALSPGSSAMIKTAAAGYRMGGHQRAEAYPSDTFAHYGHMARVPGSGPAGK